MHKTIYHPINYLRLTFYSKYINYIYRDPLLFIYLFVVGNISTWLQRFDQLKMANLKDWSVLFKLILNGFR